ncbi:MAG: acetyl-CoA carboxylase biotin carboxylase subunit [Planctomycetales bacterium]|nr:acetyl-CoA carboxylase biotin carboxylase subunit [Planctomycetales bacterium]NIM09607.1 acetyl-CoA carboxylase biotin carboxylase subunit [Planctomycetales bacterium]NIN09096.1 acetyl-CoA carboxylase biotin carboxylase subunit [Planctomycetales bacterium]NIN78203.1 acetyl-CoA carboxylase biotin carboxylase subunit [Planctomycetales bacterium]NIO35394.1 acetyl-CoA carboxylase biotin carboxylase subunit [Planctomycetales bacterium]
MYKRILIANRGEIALRIIRACRELGVETVAIFSEADRGAPYLELADEAYCIGPARSSDSYLKIDRVISTAEVGNVQAIHPGYGFLAENAHFNEVCRSCKIDFIGPSPEAMKMLGDKNQARNLARQAEVPVVPGSDGLLDSEDSALTVAHEIGFPVLVKASAGGGGKGMRVALNDLALKQAVQQARIEAEAAFGDGSVYLEKYVQRPRHVEVQVVADHHGNVVHLWERDCSLQRRHQKLVEESPAPQLSDDTRQSMCAAAVRLIQAADYTNAGTVEFIVDTEGNFYFIEVNARIQVEHPVTEMVTGIDLIKTQIRVASGEPLAFAQEDIQLHGAAIECRINAEDPAKNFRPSPGRIEQLIVPGGLGVRFDSHAYAGYTVSPFYDSMIGKLIVHQPTREEAISCMLRALAELQIEGIRTTAPRHVEMLNHSAFAEGRIDTNFVERTWGG